jgi:hypothetical protein
MIPLLVLDHDTLMALGPGAAFALLCIAAYAIYVNCADRNKD